MSKISLIIQREYLTRVKKKSFIIMTILAPILFAGMLFIPAFLATREDTDSKVIAVVDQTNLTVGAIPDGKYLKFNYVGEKSVDELKENLQQMGYYAILFIPENILTSGRVQLYSNQQTTMAVNNHISKALEGFFTNIKLVNENVPVDIIERTRTHIRVETIQWSSSGEEKSGSAELAAIIGYVSGFIMYFFVFLFGAQVMRGVIEEKSNRIVEVIISSVKPFQLMMGKVIGVALVGLTQFLIWIFLTLAIVTAAQVGLKSDSSKQAQTEMVQNIMDQEAAANAPGMQDLSQAQKMLDDIKGRLESIPIVLIIIAFIFYFLGGYLLYASLFAAVGAAVDNDTDTQQFMLPITIPIILALFVMMSAMQTPNSAIAVTFSMIPFTSMIVMMARIPYGVPIWELILSASLLIITIIGTIWMAGKIYRTGILMYGKKVNYRELWKWIKYKG